jgi:O-antigen/teichoic acid export membrane protein
MAFDDLAKHMAARDGRKNAGPVDPHKIMAEAAEADRRQTRQRNLILGTILVIGGLIGLVMFALYIADANDPHPNRLRPPETSNTYLVPIGMIGACIAAVGTGARQLWRGIRNA